MRRVTSGVRVVLPQMCSLIQAFSGCPKKASGMQRLDAADRSSRPAYQKQPCWSSSRIFAHLALSSDTPSVPAKRVDTKPIRCGENSRPLFQFLIPGMFYGVWEYGSMGVWVGYPKHPHTHTPTRFF